MESFYRGQTPDQTFAGMGDGQGHTGLISMSPVDGMHGLEAMEAMNGGVMMQGDTLDEIIMQNNKEMERRRSVQQYRVDQSRQQGMPDPHRSSMLEFGSGSHGNLNGFQFDPSNATQIRPTLHRTSSIIQSQVSQPERNSDGTRRQSTGDLAISTQFTSMPQTYGQMAPPQAFTSPMHQELTMNPQDSYNTPLSAGLSNQISMEYAGSGMEHVPAAGEASQMNMYNQHNFPSGLESPHISNMVPAFPNNIPQDESGGRSLNRHDSAEARIDRDVMTKMPNVQMGENSSIKPKSSTNRGNTSPAVQRTHSMGTTGSNESPKPQTTAERSSASRQDRLSIPDNSTAGDTSPLASESTRLLKGKGKPQNAYSSTGFDMLSVLMKVATRPNPEINIGAVDMSCAFVVCDVRSHDLPIVYCSDIFERMTGYSRHEILGQNCRFLQSPTGKVQSGVPRKYCDDDTVLFIKRRVEQRKEAQAVIINYRKGGHGFQNLLTMIPITWDDTDEVRYFVGFQTDLVEKPNSIISKNPDGTYTTNYQRGYVPRYVWSEPDSRRQQLGQSGHTIGRDDVSTVLTTIGSGESELSKRIWDKVLLENTDDVVHVLSLKGLFLYLSPSSRKVLEYDASELVGTALSSVCHPSDIVPVTRELKDTSTGAAVNVVFRIRRKHSGYTWFESHGSLHTEQGKGRKCIILVGRERPVYALSRHDMELSGGISDSELWSKMSTSGMFLFVSSNSRSLLDRQPDELVGTSIQALMRAESKIEFGRILEQVRSGKRAQFKHEMQNKRGQTLQAQSTIYPGDAAEGQKPTFLVAQTRLLRPSRSGSSSTPKQGTPLRVDQVSTASTQTPSPSLSAALSQARGMNTPQTSASVSGQSAGQVAGNNGNTFEAITSQAGGAGLPIGSQDVALASDLNVFDELKTTRSTSWQFELRQMEKKNRILKEELDSLQSARRKRKRKKNPGHVQKECANCHTRSSPEWRRGPSGNRDLCNSCGLRWTKQQGRTSPRSQQSNSSPRNNVSPRTNLSPRNGDNAIAAAAASSAKKSSPTALKPERSDPYDLLVEPQKSYSFDNGAIRPPKIEEQDEGFSSGGGGVQ